MKRHFPMLLMMMASGAVHAQTTATVAGLNCPSNTFNVSGFSMGATSRTSSFSITKTFDACSAPLLQATLERQKFSSMLVYVSEADWTFPLAFLFQNVVFTNYSLNQSAADGSSTETIALSSASITSSGPFSLGVTTTIQIQGICDSAGLSWSFNLQQSGVNAAESKTAFGDLLITKPVDSCSHPLLTAVSSRQIIPTVTLVTTPTGDASSLVQITLKNVVITEDVVSSEPMGDPDEQVSLSYQDITVENVANHTVMEWNLLTNKSN